LLDHQNKEPQVEKEMRKKCCTKFWYSSNQLERFI